MIKDHLHPRSISLSSCKVNSPVLALSQEDGDKTPSQWRLTGQGLLHHPALLESIRCRGWRCDQVTVSWRQWHPCGHRRVLSLCNLRWEECSGRWEKAGSAPTCVTGMLFSERVPNVDHAEGSRVVQAGKCEWVKCALRQDGLFHWPDVYIASRWSWEKYTVRWMDSRGWRWKHVRQEELWFCNQPRPRPRQYKQISINHS